MLTPGNFFWKKRVYFWHSRHTFLKFMIVCRIAAAIDSLGFGLFFWACVVFFFSFASRVSHNQVGQNFTFVLTDIDSKQRFGFCRLTQGCRVCICLLRYHTPFTQSASVFINEYWKSVVSFVLLSKLHLHSPAFCNVWCCATVKIIPKRIRIYAQLIFKYINFSLKCFLCAGKSSVVQTPLSLFSCSNKRTRSVMLFKGNDLLIRPRTFLF